MRRNDETVFVLFSKRNDVQFQKTKGTAANAMTPAISDKGHILSLSHFAKV